MSDAPRPVGARLRREIEARRLEPDASQAGAVRHLDELAATLTREQGTATGWLRGLGRRTGGGNAPRGLYLWGGVGRGKTLLMDWFYESLGGLRRERTHFYRFMRGVHAELRTIVDEERPLDTVAARLSRFRVLCLDEFFVSDIGDAMILAGLLRGLLDRGVTLVTTSNSPPDGLYKDGLQRQRFVPAIELLESRLDVIHLDGGVDYRLRELAQAPTYLDHEDPATAARLERRFSALTGTPLRGPVELAVEGRSIRARAVAGGIAWFEFDEICRGPRSQNDYIELARLFHTLIVSHVPVFNPGDDDAARRWVMLVDELYDRGVKLIVSAAAPPDRLYRGERLALEYERAASRLIEMQTERYLSGHHRP